MLRRPTRRTTARSAIAAVAIALALATLAPPAAAGHLHYRHRAPLVGAYHGPHVRGYAPHAYPRYGYAPDPYAPAPYGHAAVVYRCAPCGHVFHSHASFYRHLHYHHHVALWEIPFLVVHTTIGWIFYG